MIGPKRLIKRLLHAAGFDVTRIDRQPARGPLNPLCQHRIDLVFDIGANAGQYALLARRQGYRGAIVSFEPVPAAHEMLARNAESDPLWTVHPRCALGAERGVAEINIAGNSYSSSLLPMLSAHSDAAPESAYVDRVATDVCTLDEVFPRYRSSSERVLVKIDTQGFEAEVLRGARDSLCDVAAVELELSLVPLYEKQELYDYFLRLFSEQGFQLWSLSPVFSDPRTGQTLQVDGFFVRRG